MAYGYASVSVNIWFPSIIGQTSGSIDPISLWLIDNRKVPFDDQLRHSSKMAATAAILDLVSILFSDQRLGQLVRFFGGSLGVTGGRFLLMISSATHPRWPPSWILFPSIRAQTPGLIDPIFLWLIGAG
jgi:hypothetical protein